MARKNSKKWEIKSNLFMDDLNQNIRDIVGDEGEDLAKLILRRVALVNPSCYLNK